MTPPIKNKLTISFPTYVTNFKMELPFKIENNLNATWSFVKPIYRVDNIRCFLAILTLAILKKTELSEKWDVGEVGCFLKDSKFSRRLTSPTKVGIVSCLTSGMSDKWHAPVFSVFKVLAI